MSKSISTRTYFILIATIMAWGLSWPTCKVVLYDIPPYWFCALRLLGGCLVMFGIAFATGRLRLPKRVDWPLILSVGLFQYAGFTALTHFGLQHVDAGRSSILVFTTMIWVTPVAILFGERMNPMKTFGFMLGIAGILTLFSPWGINWSDSGIVFGNAMLLLAAMFWSVALLHIRFGKWHSEAIEILPWQLLIGTVPMFVIAMIVEPFSDVHFTATSVPNLAYNAIFANGLAYWGALEVGKRLPVTTVTLAFLGVPVIGLLSSVLLLGELLTLNTVVALGLLLGGLASMALADRGVGNAEIAKIQPQRRREEQEESLKLTS